MIHRLSVINIMTKSLKDQMLVLKLKLTPKGQTEVLVGTYLPTIRIIACLQFYVNYKNLLDLFVHVASWIDSSKFATKIAHIRRLVGTGHGVT